MQIIFSPIRADYRPLYEVDGDTFFVDGVGYDLSGVPQGGDLPADALGTIAFAGPVLRENSHICVTVLLSHGATAPDETLYPEPVEVMSGVVPQPPHGSDPEVGDSGIEGDGIVDYDQLITQDDVDVAQELARIDKINMDVGDYVVSFSPDSQVSRIALGVGVGFIKVKDAEDFYDWLADTEAERKRAIANHDDPVLTPPPQSVLDFLSEF